MWSVLNAGFQPVVWLASSSIKMVTLILEMFAENQTKTSQQAKPGNAWFDPQKGH